VRDVDVSGTPRGRVDRMPYSSWEQADGAVVYALDKVARSDRRSGRRPCGAEVPVERPRIPQGQGGSEAGGALAAG